VTVHTKNARNGKKKKSQLNEKPIKKKVLYAETKGVKVYGIWYE